MDYEQYTVNEEPNEEETAESTELAPVEQDEIESYDCEPSGNTVAGIAIGAIATAGITAAVFGVRKLIKHCKAKKAAKQDEIIINERETAESTEDPKATADTGETEKSTDTSKK